MFSFIEREDFIALLKEGISERSLRIEFGLTKEYIDSLKRRFSTKIRIKRYRRSSKINKKK